MPDADNKSQKQTYEHTGAWRPAFLANLRKWPNISKAAKSAGVTRQAAYKARVADPGFAQEWDDAWQEGVEHIEDVALKRATRSKNASDTLLIFMLKGLKPETYRDRFDGTMTLRGNLGVHEMGAEDLSDEDLDEIEHIYERARIAKAHGPDAEPGGSESGEGGSQSS